MGDDETALDDSDDGDDDDEAPVEEETDPAVRNRDSPYALRAHWRLQLGWAPNPHLRCCRGSATPRA